MVDLPTSAPTGRWPYGLGALAVAVCAAESAYLAAAGPQPYAQFTVGAITWRNASKSEDYALLVGFLAGFVVAWTALLLLERKVEDRLGSHGLRTVRALMAYVSLPFVVWASGLVLGRDDTRDLVYLTAIGVVLAGAVLWAATDSLSASREAMPLSNVGGTLLLLIVFGSLSALIAAFAVNRIFALVRHSFFWTGSPSPTVIAAAGGFVGLALGAWALRAEGTGLGRRLRSALSFSQVPLPWAFLMVMPTPWGLGSTISFPYPTRVILAIGLTLVAIGTVDVIRRFPRWRGAEIAQSFAALSPIALAGALFFVKFGPVLVGYLDPDDYHFGELLVPWWSLTAHGAVPFWDYVPARGLINYVNGGVGAIVFDGTAAGVVATSALVAAGTLLIGLTCLSWFIGPLPAAGAFLIMPVWSNVNHIDILNTAGLAVMWATYTRLSSTAWVFVWLAIGLTLFVTAPAQGSAVILATLPVTCWQFVRASRNEPVKLLSAAAVVAVVALVTLWATPAGLVLIGAIRYGVEHSAVGAAAHAVEWRAGAGALTPLNPWLWEGVRTAWVAVGCASAALLLVSLVRGDRARRGPLMLVGVPILILVVAFIYRAAGRIDVGHVSRLGFAAIWMLTLVLPVLLYAAWGGERWPAIITLSVAGGGLIAPVLGPLSLAAVATRAFETVPAGSEPAGATRTRLPQLGHAVVEAGSLSRLLAIDAVLDALLEPGETYLDLTNRNAQYFYLDRRVPIESGALYNLPNEQQQLRAVRALEAQQVPVVLASGSPMLMDGGPPSYRTYVVYRYLIWRYVPVVVNDLIFLVRPNRLDRVVAHFGREAHPGDPVTVLDRVFAQPNLQGLPASWGASWSTLESLVAPVKRLDAYGAPSPVDADLVTPNRFRAAGSAPALSWSLATSPIKGKDAGLLTFSFGCLAGDGHTELEVSWETPEGSGANAVRFGAASRVAVPLDASPRWLLARSITALRITVQQPDRCSEFSVEDAVLWQRRVVTATDPR